MPLASQVGTSPGEPATASSGSPRAEPRKRRASRLRLIRRLVVLFVALGVVAGIAVAWLPKPLPVDVAMVERRPLRVTVDEDGRARVKDRFVVSAPLAGNVARIELEPGDEVRSGQIVARVVPVLPPLLDERTRTSAEARLAAAVAAKRQSTAQIARAQASVDYSKTEAARVRELFARGSISRAELDRSELSQRTADAELESLRFGERVAEHEIEMTKAALKRLTGPRQGAKDEQLDIPSPVSGRVLDVKQKSEGVVQPGAPLLELGDPAALEIVVDVLTSDSVGIAPGATVVLDRWGGEPLDARVRLVEPSAFTRVSALGVDEQRVNVLIDLVSPKQRWARLGDGYRVEAHIVAWEGNDIVQAPASAIFRQGAGFAAFRIEDGKARLTPVEIGHRTSSITEIARGLEPGTRLIVHPSASVKDGVEVVPR